MLVLVLVLLLLLLLLLMLLLVLVLVLVLLRAPEPTVPGALAALRPAGKSRACRALPLPTIQLLWGQEPRTPPGHWREVRALAAGSMRPGPGWQRQPA